MASVHTPQDGILFSVLLSSVILAGSLGWMIYEFTDEKSDEKRNGLVVQFNEAADVWEGGEYKSKWNEVNSISINDTDGNNANLTRFTGDEVSDKHADVHTFDTFHFEGLMAVPLSLWTIRSSDLLFSVMSSNGTVPWKLTLHNITTTRMKTHRTSNWKQCQFTLRGSLDEKKSICTTYETLSSVCVVVGTTETGFKIAGGCGKEGVVAEPMLTYSTLPSPRFDRGEPLKNIKFSTRIIIRQDHDPILVAQELTHGSTNFGQTTGERLALGYAALGCAIIAACMLAFTLYQWKTSTPAHKYTKHGSKTQPKPSTVIHEERQNSTIVPRKVDSNPTEKEMTRHRDGSMV